MSHANSKQLTPAFDLFGKSLERVRENLNVFSIVYLISAATTLWQIYAQHHGHTANGASQAIADAGAVVGLKSDTAVGAAVAVVAVLVIANLIATLWQFILALRLAHGKNPGFSDIWKEFTAKGLKLLVLLVVISVLVIIGFIAFIVPGLIALRMLFYAPYIMLDQNVGVAEAMRRSRKLTEGNWGAVYGIILVGIVLGFSGFIPYAGPAIQLVLAAIYSVAPALRYYELK